MDRLIVAPAEGRHKAPEAGFPPPMLWVLLSAGAALFYALHGAWAKDVAARTGDLAAAWTLFACALPFLALYLAARGLPTVGPRFWPVLGLNAGLNLVAFGLFVSALRTGSLGVTYPLLALTPALVVPVEWVLLREAPSPWGGLGLGMIVAGVYLLHFGERRHGPLGPARALARSPGARKALGVAVLWSVTGTLDRVAVLEASPAFYGVALSATLAALFPLAIVAVGARTPATRERLGAGLARAGPGRLAVHGLLFSAMFVLQMEALELALASYVLAIKRTGALLAVLLGWFAFREDELRHRLLGAAVTVGGVSLLVLMG